MFQRAHRHLFEAERLGGVFLPRIQQGPGEDTRDLNDMRDELTSRAYRDAVENRRTKLDGVRRTLDTTVRRTSQSINPAHVTSLGSRPRATGAARLLNGGSTRVNQNQLHKGNELPKVPARDEPSKPPDLERLKNLASRDFSKPPAPPSERLDPRLSQVNHDRQPSPRKPADIFKQNKIHTNRSMDNMISMTNYGETDKTHVIKETFSKPSQPEKGENSDRTPRKLPRDLQRALAVPKFPPLFESQKVINTETREEAEELPPLKLPNIVTTDVEEDFVFVRESKPVECDDVTDSAYCTCDDRLTDSDDVNSRTEERSTLQLETCINCGGKLSQRSSRVPSSIRDTRREHSRPNTATSTQNRPPVALESVILELDQDITEDGSQETQTPQDKLDQIGIWHGIPDKEEETVEAPAPKVRWRLKGKQTGIYPDGAREAYLKALAVAESRRMPQQPWLYANRISRSWVFSYLERTPKPGEPKPLAEPTQTQTQTGKKTKRKKTKRFKAMKHIFDDVNVDDYFPGMKHNLQLVQEEFRPDQSDSDQGPVLETAMLTATFDQGPVGLSQRPVIPPIGATSVVNTDRARSPSTRITSGHSTCS